MPLIIIARHQQRVIPPGDVIGGVEPISASPDHHLAAGAQFEGTCRQAYPRIDHIRFNPARAIGLDIGFGKGIRASDNVMIKAHYHNAKGTLIKSYSADTIRLVDKANGRYQAMRQTMRNVITGHSTTIEYATFRTDQPVAAGEFEPRSLERAR